MLKNKVSIDPRTVTITDTKTEISPRCLPATFTKTASDLIKVRPQCSVTKEWQLTRLCTNVGATGEPQI